ncbi:hypothetical protein FEM48_Zijuj10G0079000 [Ziziphus jujuba var. spinosa]|uniref:PPIase cyclophilin-type domain-containing protein n=1 Tax=Ziziphus jujuba var. spinosa TaxID=714518 RepID=A0A978UM64_ZIZJJ|nr:hypothetical protein FEM48_Zijuj10G0079000 [Ziziphus jujuba var. spinosa]
MWSCNSVLNVFLCLCFAFVAVGASSGEPQLGSARVVFQVFIFIFNFFFFGDRIWGYRIDKGFVAQVADVVGGRSAPMNEEQRIEAEKTVVGEFSKVKHVRGILSMGSELMDRYLSWCALNSVCKFQIQVEFGNMPKHYVAVYEQNGKLHPVLIFALMYLLLSRYSDPDSGSSSFSMLLGDAPHLDGEYAIFGKVTKGDDTLKKLEQLPTRREGIFVMPKDRITILSSYYYDTEMESCEHDRSSLKRRLAASLVEIERQRMKCFP